VKDSDRINAFTVDLEEWYQGLTSANRHPERWGSLEERAAGATEMVLDLLRSGGVRATFFVLGALAERQPDLIARIRDAGHEIALHGHMHRRVDGMTPEAFAAELDRGLEWVWAAARVRPAGHRAPYFSLRRDMDWAFEALEARGFHYDSSIFPARTALYGDPAAPRLPYRVPGRALVEFPVTTLRAGGRTWPATGGFYTRVLPLTVTRWAVRQANAAGAPAVIYLHPWELDTGQRYSHVTLRERVTHYVGRRGLAAKLAALFDEFRFAALEDLLPAWM
jgi:polysaccharide deacetylase family protein (PEP-CTERM system associated)